MDTKGTGVRSPGRISSTAPIRGCSTRLQSCVLDSQSFIVTAPRERNTKKVACARAATSSQARTTGNRREGKEEAGLLDVQEEEGRVLELSRRNKCMYEETF